jgi:Cys/Met metabolism PLP-dependent enzyme
MGMARSSSTTTPGLPRSIIVRWNSASISACRPPPNISADTLKLFGMGYSWGGIESLAIPYCTGYRTATKWAPEGPALRLRIGLENVDDLKADLERGFAVFNAA